MRTFSNVKRLEHIEPGVFNLLKELRSIYIHNAPLLRRIPSGVFQLYLPRLIYLRIVHTGLEKLPYFGRLKTNAALHMIDLENNQIQAISSHEVEVHTDQLLLNFNMIQTVENEAFKGSQIAKLSLKGNKGLKVLQSRAFVGVLSLRQL
ncbi:hypothetical protein M8J76_008364 [Diaphorina citri]|nr:hypothetical protein M8J76_008364 [Diaphorina citri]